MGQKGYGRSVPEWERDGRLLLPSSESGSDVARSSQALVEIRPTLWILGRETRNKDGKWELSPSRPKTIQVAQQVVNIFVILINYVSHIILSVLTIT